MKLILTFLLSFAAFGQTRSGTFDDSGARVKPPLKTVATLPTASSFTNYVFVVTDGTSASDCTVGSGSTRALCVSNGSAWVALGGGAGVTTMTTGSADPTANCTAPSSSNLALYTQTTLQDIWACVATNTWRKVLSVSGSGVGIETTAVGSAPSPPSAGFITCYSSSTSLTRICLDASGNAFSAVLTSSGGTSNQLVDYIAATGIPHTRVLAAGDMPNPGASAKGGVNSKTCPDGDFISAINTDGTIVCTTPSGSTSVATPVASPAGGTYGGTQSVSITTATSGATVCYRDDGGTPAAGTPGTCDGSPTTTYSGAISVTADKTLTSIGTKSAMTNSNMRTDVYVITATVSTPTETNSGGSCTGSTPTWTCTGTTDVTPATATAGATICYTNDGATTPAATSPGTCSTGTTYTTAISTAATTTYKFLATKAGMTNSSVLTTTYTISSAETITQVGNTGTSAGFTGGQTTLSWNHTVGSGAHKVLYIVVAGGGNPSVTVDGAAATALTGMAPAFPMEIFEFINPSAGSRSIVATFDAIVAFGVVHVRSYEFTGVKQTTPTIDTSTYNTTTNTATVTTTVNNTWLLGVTLTGNGSTITPTTGQTEDYLAFVGGTYFGCSMDHIGPVSTGSNTMTWTANGSTPATILIAIRPFGS